MRRKGYKGRCEKKSLGKSQNVCRTYNEIQSVYADMLQNDNNIQEIRCNVLLDGLAEGDYVIKLYIASVHLVWVNMSSWRMDIQQKKKVNTLAHMKK